MNFSKTKINILLRFVNKKENRILFSSFNLPVQKNNTLSMTVQAVIQALSDLSDPKKAAFFPTFFKAMSGGYGEGDLFLGVTVPNQRKVAAQFVKKTTEADLQQLIESPYHEVRLTALLILVAKFNKAAEKGFWVDFYLRNLRYVNNWDLVDSSAHLILG